MLLCCWCLQEAGTKPVMASRVEDNLIKTSLIEQVVAPIAAHICYLTLLSEADMKTEEFIQLEASARAVAKASRNMADVASRMMVESDDDVVRLEMGPLLEPLMMSGQHVLLASQKLSIQPEVREHRDELIDATQHVLLGVVKVLLVEDDATVRKIITAAQWLLDCLRNIEDATDMSTLLKAFQAFSEALMLLHNLVMARVKDLCDDRQQNCLKTSVEILRRSIAMLHTAMYTTNKHPASTVAQESKKYILQLVVSTVNDIIVMLKGNYQYMLPVSCGYYTDRRNRLLKLLSDPAVILLKNSNFDVVLRDLVFHSMAVANSSQREIRSCVTENCKLVLQLWSEISQVIKQRKKICIYNQEKTDHHEKLCVSLMIQIHELDEAVVKATLYQVTDTFILKPSPLEQLVNTVHNILEADLENSLDVDSLQTLFKPFIFQADKMVEIASFISALAVDEKSLDSVENSMSCLVQLKDGVIPLFLELEGDLVQYNGALHKLIHIQQKWEEETEQLLNAFCDVINIKDFIKLSVQEMKVDFEKCIEAHKSQDHYLLDKHIRFLIGRMSQIVQCVRRCVDKSHDPIYRNGLLVLVKQAENSAAELTGFATTILNTNSQEEAFLLLANSITVAIKTFNVLNEGLDGLQHPHLLSPLRLGARQVAATPPIPYTEEPKQTTNSPTKTENVVHGDEKEDLAVKLKVTISEKENPELSTVQQYKIREENKSFLDLNSVQLSHSTDLLPLLYEVVNMSKAKNVEALNIVCTQIMELSSCYTQATKEAANIVEESNNQEMETLRAELVALTPLLVQAAQETAMSSVNIIDTVYKHSALFSKLIKHAHNILLPVTGMWYHTIKEMIHSEAANIEDICIQELTQVMCLCADTIELVRSTDLKVSRSERNDSITSLLNKLQKAQTNSKNLTDLLVSKSSQSDELQGPCILWALSIHVLLTSVDRILGTGRTHGRGQHQMTPKKWLAAMSENSLRIQEAARLSSLHCKDSCKAKLLEERENVKALSEVYLQAMEDFGTISRSSILMLARTELLQRQLQIKMKSLCLLLSNVNEEYVTAIQNLVSLACSAIVNDSAIEAGEIHTQFMVTAEIILRNVQTATESVQDCLNFLRDPRARSSLRFISDHLSFQMSEIVSRANLIMETQTISETLSIDIQTQFWSAKAHYLVKELYKVDGIFPVTKEQIKLGLQGKVYNGVLKTDTSCITKDIKPPRQVISEKKNHVNLPSMANQELEMNLLSQRSASVPVFSFVDSPLAYTSLILKQEAERWDIHGNQIVKVTKEMADNIYDMTQYLKRKGPIKSKDAFVSSAKDLVLSCQTVTQFVKVIADHCIDQHSTKELCIIAEQIVTITNQLTIISSVNAVTPACKSSDENLVKNAQNLLQTVIQGVRAAETACIKGLRQPEPNSEAAKVASLCMQWKKNLLLHQTQEQLNPDTDDLGLRKTSLHHATPSLAPPISVLERYK